MRSYKKKSIITGILWIIANNVICTGIKIKYKEEIRKKDIERREAACNLPLMPREIASEVLDATSTNQEYIAENRLYINNMLPDKNNQPILYDKAESESSYTAILDTSESHTNQNSKNEYIRLWLNNIQKEKYKYEENETAISTNNAIYSTSVEITSDDIPPLNNNPSSIQSSSSHANSNLSDIFNIRRNYTIRNYTKYAKKKNNLIINPYKTPQIMSESICKTLDEYIKYWKSSKKTDIWNIIQNIPLSILEIKILFDHMRDKKDITHSIQYNSLYYAGFLTDIAKYINVYGPTIYTHNDVYDKEYSSIKKETLGDILSNKEVNIYYCCCGIGSQISTEGKEEEKIRKNLNAILYIPEVYEDFYNLPQSIVDEFFWLFKKELLNKISGKNCHLARNKNFSNRDRLNLEAIIMYLLGTVQKNKAIAKEAYKKIIANNESINHYDAVKIYKLVYMNVQLFYMSFWSIYELDLEKSDRIQDEDTSLFESMTTCEEYNKILGSSAVTTQKYLKSVVQLKKMCKIENGQSAQMGYKIREGKLAVNRDCVVLSIKDHYHIQFVDNGNHTVEMIHLPIYTYIDKNDITIKCEFHTIKDIVNHLKDVFKIGENNKDDKNQENIYPFKYNRADCTWSLITENSDLDRTVQMIEEDNCNVVFYYIKENIYLEEFCFAQFIYPDHIQDVVKDDNINKPRIPLFLTKLIGTGYTIGPYEKNKIKYETSKIKEYKNLKPTNYIQEYPNESDTNLLVGNDEEKILNYAIKHYYSDFFIQYSTDPYEDLHCYSMSIKQEIDEQYEGIVISWNTRMYNSVYEYTTYSFDSDIKDERAHMSAMNQPAHASFINMLQRKNPSLNTALYGHCFYKNSTDINYKNSPLFCLTMKELLERTNSHSLDSNKTEAEVKDSIHATAINPEKNNPEFNPKDISEVIQNTKLEEIKESKEGLISIRDNNHNGCKYGIHHDIYNALNYPGL
ncbi:hypothetical protein NEIRO03_1010 [Nematocida sp. AWRm78]|nr:hypothetical protein NEIRO02_1104 [Nematocida sp. AWRm79]KAI5183414.1 hypothetical protein NEIRO03_1010 [Nematocida sp. AWRm78]